MATCPSCGDPFFANPLLSGSLGACLQELDDCAAAFSIYTSAVEKSHLFAQALGHKRRGKAPRPETVSLDTYRRGAALEWQARKKDVETAVYRNAGTSSRQVQSLLSRYAIGSKPGSKRTREMSTSTRRVKPRNTSARLAFMKANWNVNAKINSPAGKAETQRISRLWKNLSPAEVVAWQPRAALADAFAGELALGDFSALRAASSDVSQKRLRKLVSCALARNYGPSLHMLPFL